MKFIWNIKSNDQLKSYFDTDKLSILKSNPNLSIIANQKKSRHFNHQFNHLNQQFNYSSKNHLTHSSFEYFYRNRTSSLFRTLVQYLILIFILPVSCKSDQSNGLNHTYQYSTIYPEIYPQYKKCKDKEELYKFNKINQTETQCPPSFDGFLCWEDTNLNSNSTLDCPLIFEFPNKVVTRQCLKTGQWATNGNYNKCGSNRFSDSRIDLSYLEYIHNYVWSNLNFTGLDGVFYYDEFYNCIDQDLYEDFKDKENIGNFCNATFDGFRCWPKTPANTTVYRECPSHYHQSNSTASKQCMQDAEWFRHAESKQLWTNYLTCIDYEDLRFRRIINNCYLLGYTISLIAILISLYIFFSFKRSLKGYRIFVHKNLFISFVFANLHWIYVYLRIFNQVEVLRNNSIICRIILFNTKYFTHTNYLWTFCEGLYLHSLVVNVFVNEQYLVYFLMLIGWFSPLVYFVPYFILRILPSNHLDSIRCWIDDSVYYENLLVYPIFFVIMLNMFFLINIIRVLFSKLKSNGSGSSNAQEVNKHKKTIKAFFFLFPLLSLQYVITLIRPSDGTKYERVYDSILCLAASLQGLCVSLIYCFFNNEVIQTIKNSFKKQRLSKNNNNQRSAFLNRNRSINTTVV